MINSLAPMAEPQTSIGQQVLENDELGKDAFLTLLTVQLQNQDPMDPVKNEDFVAQLAQFSSLEQLQSINEAVSGSSDTQATVDVQRAIEANTAVSLMGKQVEIPTDTVVYGGQGAVELGYSLAGPANRLDLMLFDEGGNLIRTLTETTPEAGIGSVQWDGKDADGRQVDEGSYHLVPSAVNGQGGTVAVSASLAGTVTGVRYDNGVPILILEGGEAPLSGVTRVY